MRTINHVVESVSVAALDTAQGGAFMDDWRSSGRPLLLEYS